MIYDRVITTELAVLVGKLREWVFLRTSSFGLFGKFHATKHKKECRNNPLMVPRLRRRVAKINTSASEQTSSWFRNYARTMNELRPARNKFLVLCYAKEHNKLIEADCATHIQKLVRTTANKGSTPYACDETLVLKRPAARL